MDWAELYRRDGMLVLSDLLTDVEIAHLRAHCDERRAGMTDAELCNNDCVLEASNMPPESVAARTDPDSYLRVRHPNESTGCATRMPLLGQLLMCKLPAVVVAACGSSSDSAIDRAPCLFNEHFVVKPQRMAGEFTWHTDVAHQLEALFALGRPAEMVEDDYLSVWMPLDDVHDDNGPLLLLPLSSAQPPDAPYHLPASESCRAWLASAAGVVSASGLAAGSAVVFSSRLWHCSLPNRSDGCRRVFYAQYSAEPIVDARTAPLALAVRTSPDAKLLPDASRVVELARNLQGERASTHGATHHVSHAGPRVDGVNVEAQADRGFGSPSRAKRHKSRKESLYG